MMQKNKFRWLLFFGLLTIPLLAFGYAWAQGELQSYLPIITQAIPTTPTPTATATLVPTATSPPTATATTTATPTMTPTPIPTLPPNSETIVYTLDKTAVPPVAFYDLTLKIYVGSEGNVELTTNSGASIPYQYDAGSGMIIFTTDATEIHLTFPSVITDPNVGVASKATLKDDKHWAWSHGFDDNVHLKASVEVFESKGWRGTLFMIANSIDDERDQDWTFDVPALHRLIANGWSIGNHTWAHECQAPINFKETIRLGFFRLSEIVLSSSRPDYVMTSFAAPCFVADYHQHVLDMRNAGDTTILYNESGSQFMTLIEPGATENYTAEGRTAVPFNLDAPIGRDTRFEWDVPAAIADIDWVAAHSNANRHIWYNSLTHGTHEAVISQIVNHIESNYGPNVWVAPSDHIYNYILVRDNTIVNWEAPLGPTPTSTPSATDPDIEIANISGVSGYEIGIFGTGFGTSQGNGSVTIADTPAAILEWRDSFIRAIVPDVADGETTLVVNGHSNNSDSNPFTVYSIDPAFLNPPDTIFVNIAHGKTAHLHNLESYFCFAQPGNSDTPPTTFLTDYTCGFAGVTDSGSATFRADTASGEEAIIAMQFDTPLAGEHIFQFYVDSNWYPNGGGSKSTPADYSLQVSGDSTDGIDGSWETVFEVEDNGRLTRLHKIDIPSGNYTWFRMRVTDGLSNLTAEAGNDFEIKEIRLYKPQAGSSSRPDALAIYGDSLTYTAFEAIGPSGLANAIQNQRGISNDLIFTAFGLAGQNSIGLIDDSNNEADLYDALAIDDMENNALYWGIALGTNDTFGGSNELGNPFSNVQQFDDRLDAAVQDLLARGRIPIIARLPDTVESRGGFGDLPTKKKIAEDIDTIAARYRLIPGPDLYTAFRYNNDFNDATYFNDDGTHHTPSGEARLIALWAEALVQP